MKILIVEDNPLLGKSLKRGLEEAGMTVDLVPDGEEGMYFCDVGVYDVIVLDWMLPKVSGIELLRTMRAKGVNTPAIMITARDGVVDRVKGLERGADDYIVKPFEFVELQARIYAVHRRSIGQGTSKMELGVLTIDFSNQCAWCSGKRLDLTGKEYDLLAALASPPDRLVKRHDLASKLYELDGEPDSNSLDVLLARLRKKIAGSGVAITTLRGKGFLLQVPT